MIAAVKASMIAPESFTVLNVSKLWCSADVGSFCEKKNKADVMEAPELMIEADALLSKSSATSKTTAVSLLGMFEVNLVMYVLKKEGKNRKAFHDLEEIESDLAQQAKEKKLMLGNGPEGNAS